MLIEAEFACAFCGSANAVSVDPSAGRRQNYTEDCQTWCRPNVLRIEVEADEDGAMSAFVEAEPEMDLS